MANKNLLTYNAKLSSVEQVYYSPVSVLPQANTVPLASIYCYLSKVDPWDDEQNPPAPTQDQKSIKKIFKNIFAVKQILSTNISPVVERFDWVSGETYEYYQDDIDMFETDANGSLIRKFYVKNRYDQVFKCLWNNNSQPSTVEPYFEPGTYGTNNIYQGSDVYKWKFIFTVDTGSKVKFMDSSWIPVPIGANTPNPTLSSAGCGSIDVINVVNTGSGYDPANSIVSVVITGDGYGAAATADVTDGSITDVIVTNPGTNYTYADIKIVSESGSGANVVGPTSPIGGHGYDPVSELGCFHVMMTAEFDGDEGGLIPTDIDFHQLGIIINPTSKSTNPYPADATIYKTTTDLVVAPGFGSYVADEIVWQGSTFETATFVGTVLSFDQASNVIRVINTTGSLTINAPVFGKTSITTRTLLTYSEPDFILQSGYMSFIENRTGIQRSADGIEQFKIVIGY